MERLHPQNKIRCYKNFRNKKISLRIKNGRNDKMP